MALLCTDAANSFNFSTETDYSTTEKIVGTWIDGKPLYQKTYSALFTISTQNSWEQTDVASIANISIKNINGVVYRNDGQIIQLGGESDTGSRYIIRTNGSQSKVKLNYYTNTSITDGSGTVYVTLQYTKTTD